MTTFSVVSFSRTGCEYEYKRVVLMLGRIKEILWGTPTAVIILLVGAYFTFALLRRGAFGKKSVRRRVQKLRERRQ